MAAAATELGIKPAGGIFSRDSECSTSENPSGHVTACYYCDATGKYRVNEQHGFDFAFDWTKMGPGDIAQYVKDYNEIGILFSSDEDKEPKLKKTCIFKLYAIFIVPGYKLEAMKALIEKHELPRPRK